MRFWTRRWLGFAALLLSGAGVASATAEPLRVRILDNGADFSGLAPEVQQWREQQLQAFIAELRHYQFEIRQQSLASYFSSQERERILLDQRAIAKILTQRVIRFRLLQPDQVQQLYVDLTAARLRWEANLQPAFATPEEGAKFVFAAYPEILAASPIVSLDATSRYQLQIKTMSNFVRVVEATLQFATGLDPAGKAVYNPRQFRIEGDFVSIPALNPPKPDCRFDGKTFVVF